MESAPTAEAVYQGVYAMFNTSNMTERQKATKWLEQFQHSVSLSWSENGLFLCYSSFAERNFARKKKYLISIRTTINITTLFEKILIRFISFLFHSLFWFSFAQVYSWQIADELLQQRRDRESCFFAAQTMRNKIQYSFHELPDDAHISLRDSLIVHISQITDDTHPTIVTQLCLALADLALLMQRWENPVRDLIERLSSNENSLWPLINIIQFLPEEINSRNLRLGENRRDEIHTQLESNSKWVLGLLCESLTKCAQQNADKIHLILKCFTSWICVHAIDICDTANNLIVVECFNLMNNQATDLKLHEAASDLICCFLQCLEGEDQPVLEKQIFQNVCALEQAYHLSVAHEDTDKSMNYCRIFSTLAESFLFKMMNLNLEQQPHFAIKSLDLVLNCISHYDYEVAEITFTLWYRLSEDLYQKNNDQLSYHFQPYIERLLTSIYRLSQIDPDHDGLLKDDESFSVSYLKLLQIVLLNRFIWFVLEHRNSGKRSPKL